MRGPPAFLPALVAFATGAFAASEAGDVVSQRDFQRVVALVEDLQARLDLRLADDAALRQQVDALQAGNAALRERNAALHERVDSLQALVSTPHTHEAAAPTKQRDEGGPPSSTTEAAIGPRGEALGRRLTGASTYIAVNAKQIHELPNGHTCSNTGFNEASARLVLLDSGGPSVRVATTVASADLSFAAVGAKDFDVNEIQRINAPFKIVHASDCATAPTLELPLSTTVAALAVTGSLTVNGAAVSGGGDLTWVPITGLGTTCQPGFESLTAAMTASYAIKDGLVFMKGAILKTGVGGGSTTGVWDSGGDCPGNIPSAAQPADTRIMLCTGNSGYEVKVFMIESAGRMWVRSESTHTGSAIFLDGIVYAL